MSLRRKDDWDEALEESRRNSARTEQPVLPGYDYCSSITFTAEELARYQHVTYGYKLVWERTPEGAWNMKVERLG